MKIKTFPYITQLQKYSQGTQVPFVDGEFVSLSKIDRKFSISTTHGAKAFLKKDKDSELRKRVPTFLIPSDRSWKSLQEEVESFFTILYPRPLLFVESGTRVV